jgi:sarcosine oxidase
MGSAAAYHLAQRGQRVLGLERFQPAHVLGSSHGRSRIIRQAYFEDPAYVPLLFRAYELWARLEQDTGARLLDITGGLMLGEAGSAVLDGSLRSAREHGIAHELLDAAAIRRRFPPFRPGPDTVALLEKQAGVLRPEAAVQAHLDAATRAGAELHFEEPIAAWEALPGGVRVTTGRGVYEAERLVITPGPWAPSLLAGLGLPLVVERQVQLWFDPAGGVEPFLPDRFPIYIWQVDGETAIYGFPAMDGPDGGVKAAFHHGGSATTADTLLREVRPEEVEALRLVLAEHIPALAGALRAAAPCMYTNTPDEHFVIALHPRHSQVAIAAGFSGHGFKFAPAIGEILADLAAGGATAHPTGFLSARRFATG